MYSVIRWKNLKKTNYGVKTYMKTTEKKRIYLDYAATTPVRSEVMEEMLPCFQTFFGNPSSIYSTGREAKRILEESRERFAKAINADAKEIFFVSGGSESDNWAIRGSIFANRQKGKHIITSAIEHHAVLNCCKSLEKNGYYVTYIETDSEGIIDPEKIRAAIRKDTILVTIMTANNEIGTIQPIKKISAICREYNVLFHTDAVQAMGSIPMDVKDMGVDMASFSGHKIYAPKGIGVLYIRKGVAIVPMLEGGAQERRKRAGTENIPYIAGIAKAAELAVSEQPAYAESLTRMRDSLIREVSDRIPHIRLNGHAMKRLPGNVNFSFEFIEGESLLLMLDSMGYEASSGSACTSGSLDPSHVLLAIGLPHEIAHGSLRISLGKSSKEEDITPLVDALEKIVLRLREMSPLYDDYLKGKVTEPNCMFSEKSDCSKITTGCYKKPQDN
jgi:cysteine desulfurase